MRNVLIREGIKTSNCRKLMLKVDFNRTKDRKRWTTERSNLLTHAPARKQMTLKKSNLLEVQFLFFNRHTHYLSFPACFKCLHCLNFFFCVSWWFLCLYCLVWRNTAAEDLKRKWMVQLHSFFPSEKAPKFLKVCKSQSTQKWCRTDNNAEEYLATSQQRGKEKHWPEVCGHFSAPYPGLTASYECVTSVKLWFDWTII